jgi:hypothetical protein
MSTLTKFVMAMIAVLFVSLAVVVILKAQPTQFEQPAAFAPMNPTPLEPQVGTPEPAPPEFGIPQPPIVTDPTSPPRRRLLPGRRQGLFGGRFRQPKP